MSRALVIIYNDADRARAAKWCQAAPHGMRVEFKEAQRSTEQNARLWANLSDIAAQKEHCCKRYSTDQWKALFLNAMGREISFLPSLDGSTFIPWGNSSSDLSKAEMTALLDFIQCWATENGVTLHGPNEQAVA